MIQAQNQFTAGYAKQALHLVRDALTCKQEVRLYQLGATVCVCRA